MDMDGQMEGWTTNKTLPGGGEITGETQATLTSRYNG